MAEIDFKFELGHKVKCLLTGFTGIIDARIECLNGCKRYSIVGRMQKGDNQAKTLESDEQNLTKVDNGLLKEKKIKKNGTGGPMKFGTY